MSRPRTPVPGRPALNREAIVQAALDIITAEGTAAVSMRRVADRFDTGPASLYAHVDSREELLLLAYDAVAATIDRPVVDPPHWREQLITMLTQSRQILTSHGDIAVMGIGRIPVHPHTLDVAESMIALLVASGMAEQDIALAADLLPLYLTAVAYEEGLEGLGKGEAGGFGRGEAGEDYLQQVEKQWHALPAERYPAMVSMMSTMFTAGDGDERFRFGLEVLLDGLVARAKSAGRAAAG